MIELNEAVKQKLLAPFEAAEVRIKTSPSVMAYITARVAMTRLDEALPFQWSFRVLREERNDLGTLSMLGELSLIHADGTGIAFQDWGSAPPDIGNAPKKQAKHAHSDCFKRCAVHVGIGRYLYELTGTQGNRIGEPGLKKALAAVGYRGPWDDRHCGAVGGIREGDLEDEADDPARFHDTGGGLNDAGGGQNGPGHGNGSGTSRESGSGSNGTGNKAPAPPANGSRPPAAQAGAQSGTAGANKTPSAATQAEGFVLGEHTKKLNRHMNAAFGAKEVERKKKFLKENFNVALPGDLSEAQAEAACAQLLAEYPGQFQAQTVLSEADAPMTKLSDAAAGYLGKGGG